jgi:adenine-specific DNA-methyltransferase
MLPVNNPKDKKPKERERESSKQNIVEDLRNKVELGILEEENFKLLEKLVNNAENITEALQIAQMGISYKKTGLYYQTKLDKINDGKLHYLKKNTALSFDQGGIKHKLLIGDNYHALLNLLITHVGRIDIIYIDPPYACDYMGDFAKTNYTNNITRDNLLSMLEPRLKLAKELLTKDGLFFCSIDDRNYAYLKVICDQIFGEAHFVNTII